MQVLILCTLIAASQAAVLLNHGLIGTGASTQYNTQDGLGNYAFGYNEGHATGGTFRKETGGHGVVAGSYGLSAADGRQRIVNYVADAGGFRASINTNEPGVEPKDPAAASINKAGIIAAPALLHAAVAPAPALHHAAFAAPALHHAPIAAPGLHYAAAAPYGGAFGYNTAIGHHGLGYHGYW